MSRPCRHTSKHGSFHTGRPEFVVNTLFRIAERQGEFLQKIPDVKDLQCAWLILLYCGVTRATFYTRSVRPDLIENFSGQHDEQVWRCFCELVGVAPEAPAASVRASTILPLAAGGLGLRTALRLRQAARASWADTIKMVQARHPEVADAILRAVEARHEAPSVGAINSCTQHLWEAGFAAPSWVELARWTEEAPREEEEEPNQPGTGWQVAASQAVETSFMTGLMPTLSDPGAALLISHGGPLASAPFVCFPTDRSSRFELQPFRVLLLRRLRLPLPLLVRVCR